MPRRVSLAPIILVFATAATSISARPSTDIQVASTIADVGESGSPLRVRSDGKGAYFTETVKRTTHVQSILIVNPTGTDWSLTTYYSSKGGFADSSRRVFVDLREQARTGSFATPTLGTDEHGLPVDYGYVTAHLIMKCSAAGVDMTRLAQGEVALCPGGLRFRAPDGVWYRLSFQPDNFPQSERFTVACVRAGTAGCELWTITPGGMTLTGSDPNPKSLHTLLQIDEGGTILAVGGDYYLSYSFTVAR